MQRTQDELDELSRPRPTDLDILKNYMAKEWEDMRGQIKLVGQAIHRNELSHAAFILGCLHSICRFHKQNLLEKEEDSDNCE